MPHVNLPRLARRAVAPALASVAALTLAACSQDVGNGLPAGSDVTNQSARITSLWNYTWIAGLIVLVIVMGLILFPVARYRKRKGDEKLPVQTRVNLPLELMYTIIPLLMIGVLFKYTAEDIAAIQDTSQPAEVHIQVVGKQWSWDFNYLDENVYLAGVQPELTGKEGVQELLPALYLPVNKRVEFTVDSRDVIHSFWIPAFLFKVDAIPGRTNTFQVIPQREGTYAGKCAELCGEYHASMLFTVKVVSQEEYDAYIEHLRDIGNIGTLGLEYNRDAVVEGGNG